MPSPRLVGVWLGVIVLLTIFTNRTRSDLMAAGVSNPSSEGLDPAFRLAREALTWGLSLVLLNYVAVHKRHNGVRGISPQVALVGVFAAGCVASTLFKGGSATSVAAGLRVAPLLFILASLPHYAHEERRRLAGPVVFSAALLVCVETALAVHQVASGIPAFFGATFLGARPYGTLVTPNVFGMAALAGLVLLVVTRPPWWRLLSLACVFAAVLSGSRTATLGVLAVLLGTFAGRIRFRWLLIPNLLIVGYVGYLATSSPALSGRDITSEGRLNVWADSLASSMHSPLDWLIGSGVGVGSNASVTANGLTSDQAPISDSALVALVLSFGIVGLLIAAAGVMHLLGRMDDRRWVIVPPAALMALTVNLPEVAPANVVLLVAAALALPECGCAKPPPSILGAGDLAPLGAIPGERHR